MTTTYVPWTDPSGQAHITQLEVHSAPSANPAQPVVILLHGMGGTSRHMAVPLTDFPLNFQLNAPPPPSVIDLPVGHIFCFRGT
jgi:predicted esterase